MHARAGDTTLAATALASGILLILVAAFLEIRLRADGMTATYGPAIAAVVIGGWLLISPFMLASTEPVRAGVMIPSIGGIIATLAGGYAAAAAAGAVTGARGRVRRRRHV